MIILIIALKQKTEFVFLIYTHVSSDKIQIEKDNFKLYGERAEAS